MKIYQLLGHENLLIATQLQSLHNYNRYTLNIVICTFIFISILGNSLVPVIGKYCSAIAIPCLGNGSSSEGQVGGVRGEFL